MAERFYSLHSSKSIYYNNNSNVSVQPQQQQQTSAQQQQQQQQQLLQQQQPSLVAPMAAAAASASATALANVSVSDYNNNNNNNCINNNNNNTNKHLNNNMRYFGGAPGMCAGIASVYDKMLSYQNSSTGSLLNYPGSYVTGTPGCDPLTSIMSGNNNALACQYAHANGSASCFNRNRYMPYNHNRACAAAAAAAVAAVTGQPIVSHQLAAAAATSAAAASAVVTSASNNFNASRYQQQQQQQYAPLYQQHTSAGVPVSTALQQGIICPTISSAANVHEFVPYVGIATANCGVGSTAAMTNSVVAAGGCIASVASGGAIAAATTAAAGVPVSLSSLVPTDPLYSTLPTAAFSTSTVGTAQAYTTETTDAVTLQITNLDYSLDETSLRNFLLNQLKPITPVVSLVFEGSSYAKVTVPDLYFAKQVVSNLHRKKIGHKRMLVSYTRDSSLTEINTLRCQVAGLLKDVPYYTLPMYKFRELFQSRFKTSISVLDLYKMQDICTINSDNNEDKFISLQPELVNSLESSPLMEGLQHSVPYCTVHFKREQHKGWAEQEIEPLPNVCMTIAEIQQIIYPLLQHHPGDVPVATLVHCIEGELKVQIKANETGVNLEHLVCCVQGIQIQVNNFGIKILELIKEGMSNSSAGASSSSSSNGNTSSSLNLSERNNYAKNSVTDPLFQISREVIELVKSSPKSTMKFNRFIPAYHNHFGKQCRVADYGYTKLIELFEALSSVVQIMGDGENRQITLTHRTQIRRFTSDLLRVLRAHGNNSVLLSQLPNIFAQTQNRSFDVTDYGVCDIVDILDGLVNSNIVVVSTVQNGKDVLISIPKRKQTNSEIEKTCIFAGEMVELFRNALQYTILFQKFVRSYHYHFAYQCRLSDYGFLKLADLMEAIHGVVEMELTNDEDKKIYLSPVVARRVFAEQCEELIRNVSGSSVTTMKLDQVLKLHKKKYGYQILPQTLGVKNIHEAIELLPYVELTEKDDCTWITCHNNDAVFRTQCYRACKHLMSLESPVVGTAAAGRQLTLKTTAGGGGSETVAKKSTPLVMSEFMLEYNAKNKNYLTEPGLKAMKHAIELHKDSGDKLCVRISSFMKFLVSIVRLLEQRPTMFLHELKCALDCGVTTTFEYGFPNLYTLISAYPDLFALNVGATQERSDVALSSNCELRQTSAGGQPAFGSLKLTYGKQKATRSSSRPPLGEHNGRQLAAQPPPHKTRALAAASTDYGTANGIANSTAAYKATQMPAATGLGLCNMGAHYAQYNAQAQPYLPHHQATKPTPPCSFSSVSLPTSRPHNSINSSNHSTASQHSSALNTSCSNLSLSGISAGGGNKENSFNSSMQFFNSSFNSPNTSFDLNTSMPSLCAGGNLALQGTTGSFVGAQSNKLWDRRQTHYFQQQQQQPQQQQQQTMLGSTLSGLMMQSQAQSLAAMQPSSLSVKPSPPSALSESTTGLYELVSNMPNMCPLYEPPKPDTPPSEHMPFWIDPIWSNTSNGHGQHQHTANKTNLFPNVRLPELKSMNVLPMLLSPYTLSKTENMKQVFNFDNHDRKIA